MSTAPVLVIQVEDYSHLQAIHKSSGAVILPKATVLSGVHRIGNMCECQIYYLSLLAKFRKGNMCESTVAAIRLTK